MEKLGRAAIAHMRKRLPGAVVMVYDNYNSLAVGFGPDEKVSTLPLSIAFFPRWATLFFMQGSTLPDPEGCSRARDRRSVPCGSTTASKR